MKTTDFEKRVAKFVKSSLKLVSLTFGLMFLITFISLWIWGYEASSGTRLVSDFVVNIFGSIMWITILMVAAIGIYSAFSACNVLLIDDEVESAYNPLIFRHLTRVKTLKYVEKRREISVSIGKNLVITEEIQLGGPIPPFTTTFFY